MPNKTAISFEYNKKNNNNNKKTKQNTKNENDCNE